MFVYNEANAIDRDPTRPLPPEDIYGRMRIEEPKSAIIDNGAAAICMVPAGMSSLFVVLYLTSSVTPYFDQYRFFATAICAGFLLVPLTVILIFILLLPARLDINEDGITFVISGKARKIDWEDIREIHLCTLIDAESDTLTRYVKLINMRHSQIRLPGCRVSPRVLAHYLVSRRNRHSAAPAMVLREFGWLETLRAGSHQPFNSSAVILKIILAFAYIVALFWLFQWTLHSWGIGGGSQ